ncbi:MAG: peptidase inhibitor family I36 protein [Terracidiphilus sp.]|nr:peptidase inhibitor family I36 protein [Terracidiphilus sp.]
MRLRFVLLSLLVLSATCLSAPAQYPNGRGPRPPRAGACFYNDPGFTGNYFCMSMGDRMPAMPPGFNDSITSVRVFGGARVRLFADGNFQSVSIMLDHDVDGLYRIRVANNPSRSWDDVTSSVVVLGGRGDRDEWGPRDRPYR